MVGVIDGNTYENEKINKREHFEPHPTCRANELHAICAVQSSCSTIGWLETIRALFSLFYFPIVFSLPPSAQI